MVAPPPRRPSVMVWVISGSLDKARSLLGRFCDVCEGEGALSADFPSRAERVPDWEVWHHVTGQST